MQTYNVSRLPSMIKIGYDGENNWRPQAFDCTPLLQNHPNGTITLWLLPHGETQAFPVALTRDGNSVVWTPLSEEMTAATGALQLVCTDGTDVGKSAVVLFRVDESIIPGAEHPAAVPSWATQTIERAENAADRAEEAAESIDVEHLEQTIAAAVEAYLIEHPVQAPVESVNGKTGAVRLNATDVGALPANTPIPPAITVDSALSSTSENPVQNKVINAALQSKGTYSKPSGGIPASDLADGVIPNISGKVDKITGYGLVSSRNVTNGYELAINENGTVSNIPVVGISSYNTAMQQASQALAAKADASSVYTKTEIDNKGYQTATDVQTAIAAIPDELPAVTSTDNGKFLRVVSGAWAAQAVPSAESNSFGGGA